MFRDKKNWDKMGCELVTTNDDVGKCTVREMHCYTMDCSPDVTEKKRFSHRDSFAQLMERGEQWSPRHHVCICRCVLGNDCYLP